MQPVPFYRKERNDLSVSLQCFRFRHKSAADWLCRFLLSTSTKARIYSFFTIKAAVSTCSPLSKPILKSFSIIGSLNRIDLIHWPLITAIIPFVQRPLHFFYQFCRYSNSLSISSIEGKLLCSSFGKDCVS